MLREVPFGGDGDFSQKALIDRINSDLGNDLGNLLNRLIGMASKYSDGKISSQNVQKFYESELSLVNDSISKLEPLLFDMQLHRYLEELWRPLAVANRAIDNYKPWELMKNSKEEKALALLGLIANILAKVAVMLHSIMPKTTEKIAYSLGFEIDNSSFESLIKSDKLLEDFTIRKIEPLFPRVEEQLLKEPEKEAPKQESKPKDAPKKSKKESEVVEGIITIDEFFKVSLKLGTVLEADEVKKSKKLLKLQVDLGEESPRQIVAGIKEWYSPEDLVGTQVAVVANLKPAKLMGLLSEGMILAVKDESGLSLLRPEAPKKAGTPIG
jgi:methionyl-tRNA synthetase